MPIFWLSDNIQFPDPHFTGEEDILAVGGDLSRERLLEAYRIGLFPWFNPQDPILWWCPDPRYVIFPDEIKVSKSMRPYFNQQKFKVTFDLDFESVITACQDMYRPGQNGTWLTNDMKEAYIDLHQKGYCHSVEVWEDNTLVGGLYGMSLGKVFFGESMFAKKSNASKYGFITLVQKLKKKGYWLIDCQQGTDHLISLGARGISRNDFLKLLKKNEVEKTAKGKWTNWLAS